MLSNTKKKKKKKTVFHRKKWSLSNHAWESKLVEDSNAEKHCQMDEDGNMRCENDK